MICVSDEDTAVLLKPGRDRIADTNCFGTSLHVMAQTDAGNLVSYYFFRAILGDGPNTVSEITVSNTELSEFFGPHRGPGRELSELLSAYYWCAKANSPSFSQDSPSLP